MTAATSTTEGSSTAQRWIRRSRWLCAAVAMTSIVSLLPYLTSWTEVVRMRNALLMRDGPQSDFTWTPATRPPSFQLDAVRPYPEFVETVRRLKLDAVAQ